MIISLFGRDIIIQKTVKKAFGANIGYWYKIPGDPTDKVRLIRKTDPKNEKRCIKCGGSLREGLVWDCYFVTIGLFNVPMESLLCTNCAPDLSVVLKAFSREK